MKSPIYAKVAIRLATPQDEHSITKIQYDAIKVLSIKDYNPQQLKALLKSKSIARRMPETIFIAEIQGKPVGFASLLYPPNTIGAMFVDPNYARRKVGTQLLQRLEREAIEHKIPILWVCASLTGYGFYKANKYQAIGERFIPLYSTFIPCIQMKKRLLPVSKDEILQEISQFLVILIIGIIVILFLSNF